MSSVSKRDATNQLAKMNFNIQMEKAKRHDLETEIAEQELREANFRKHELELQKRRSNLDEATAVNN